MLRINESNVNDGYQLKVVKWKMSWNKWSKSNIPVINDIIFVVGQDYFNLYLV